MVTENTAPIRRVPSRTGLFSAFAALTVLLLLLGSYTQSFAIVNSHDWTWSHTGYSVRQIPGTGVPGAPEEFLSAGTNRNPSSGGYGGYYGFHLMRLDANGAVVNKREVWIDIQMPWQFGIDYEVADLTPDMDANGNYTGHFWIVIQARQYFPAGAEEDYIYCHKVRDDCTDPTPIQAFYIRSNQNALHRHLYATSTVCYNGMLFMCGYAAAGNTAYANYPLSNLSDKVGLVISYDIASGALNHYMWNTVNSTYDFDEALKLKLSDGTPGEILMTGAMNSDMDASCGVFAARFDVNLNFSGFQGIIPPIYQVYSIPPPDDGIYGIDIYEDQQGDVYVLCNHFQGNTNLSWGILKLQNNMNPYGPGTISYAGQVYTQNAWAKQFFYEPQGGGNVTFRIVGEQAAVFCDATVDAIAANNPASQVPSYTAVTPWVEHMDLGWNASGLIFNMNWHKMHLTANGTTDYYSGFPTYNPPPANAALQDEERMYTAALQINNDPALDIVIIAPVSNVPNGAVGTKFLRVNNNGDETMCNNQVEDCNALEGYEAIAVGIWQSAATPGIYADRYRRYREDDPPVTEYDCTTGYYKQSTGIAKTATGISTDVTLYPNPASKEINLKLEERVGIGGKFSFVLTDMAGRQVYKQDKADPLATELNIKLPSLAPGMYIANITINKSTHIKRVVIE